MNKAGGIVGIIGGVFGLIAAVATLFIGGLGSAFGADKAGSIIGFGWGGILCCFLVIVFAAIAMGYARIGGTGLIVASILGAVLGGTFVAVCMVLSLLGGVLALFGKKPVAATSMQSASSDAATPTKSRMPKVIIGGAIGVAVVVVGLIAVVFISQLDRGGNREETASQDLQAHADPMAELAAAHSSGLSPEGELAKMFSLGSAYTDVQRENKLREIQGQIVQWRLPVYEVDRDGDGYRIMTRSEDLVGTAIYLTPRTEAERQAVEALKTDDEISIKGKIAGVSLRMLQIRPAILATAVATGTTPPSVPRSDDANQVKPAADSVPATASVADSDSLCEGLDMTIDAARTECMSRRYQAAVKALNQEYAGLLVSLDENQRLTLRDAQVAWGKDVKAECAAAGKAAEGGSMEHVAVVDCNLRHAEERIAFLKGYRP